MNRKEFLHGAVMLTAALTMVPFLNAPVQADVIRARLCSDCGFGSRVDNCVKCGKWVGSANIQARLCGDCGFGSKAENCAKCGKWCGSTTVYAKLCGDCGFGSKAENCVKCGKWCGA